MGGGALSSQESNVQQCIQGNVQASTSADAVVKSNTYTAGNMQTASCGKSGRYISPVKYAANKHA